jgi:lipopolysaccharide transport system ATP-binding protein
MEREILIKAENVSKKFCRDLKKSLWYGVKDIAEEFTGCGNSRDDLRPGEFWSVNDVSFELKRGECLGMIGPNGAGKSTLLKLLNGLIKPDQGRVTMRGRVGALIELGAGFNPILTGRENIYVNGAVLGFTKDEINKKLDPIIEFSELAEFIEAPVQNYSSGMKVRLGFAIASQMDPDVLLIDEVLAVGDIGFRAKCFNAINNLMERTAVIFVTHAMPQVSRICSDVMVLSRGKCVFQGKDIPKGIDHYYTQFEAEKERVGGSGIATIHSVELESNSMRDVETVQYMEDLVIHIDSTIDGSVKNPNISLVIINQELQNVAQCSSFMNGKIFQNCGERTVVSLTLGKINLNPGIYTIEITITAENRGEVLSKHQNIKTFRVNGEHIGFAPVQILGDWRVSKKITSEIKTQ